MQYPSPLTCAFIALSLTTGCFEAAPLLDEPDATRAHDAAPDVAPADVGWVDAEPSADAALPDATAPAPCTHDDACDDDQWCRADGRCRPVLAVELTPTPDGLSHAAAAAFDLTPDYIEPWTDHAGPNCPRNVYGRFDGLLDVPHPDDPCLDHFTDANNNGHFDAVWLAGEGADRPAMGVDVSHPPAGRVLTLLGPDTVRVLITLDLYALDAGRRCELVKRLSRRTGLAPAVFMIHTTGARNGPDAIGLSGPTLRIAGGAQAAALRARIGGRTGLLETLPFSSGVNTRWWRSVADRAAIAISRAAAQTEPVELRAATTPTLYEHTQPPDPLSLPDADQDGVHNDTADLRAWRQRPSTLARDNTLPGAPTSDLKVVGLYGRGGAVAIIMSWTPAPGALAAPILSAGYPGAARERIETGLPGATAVWLTGAGPDTFVTGGGVFVPETDSAGVPLDAHGGQIDHALDAAPAASPEGALGRLLARQALDALADAEQTPLDFSAQARDVWLPLSNPRYGLASQLGLLGPVGEWITGRVLTPQWVSGREQPACGGLGCLRYRLELLSLGPVRWLSTPGRLAAADGQRQASVHFGGQRSLLDVDADRRPDANDDELTPVAWLGTQESIITLAGPVNPQQFSEISPLASATTWVLGGTNGGVGSLRTQRGTINVFEGQLNPLLALVTAPDEAALQLCDAGYPCEHAMPLDAIAQHALEVSPTQLADLRGAHEVRLHEVWFEETVEALEWHIEDAAGERLSEGRHLTLGPGDRAYLPDGELQGLELGHDAVLVLPELDARYAIIERVQIELRRHPNPGDVWSASSPDAGALVHNTACALLDGAPTCPYPLPWHGADPNDELPQGVTH